MVVDNRQYLNWYLENKIIYMEKKVSALLLLLIILLIGKFNFLKYIYTIKKMALVTLQVYNNDNIKSNH